MSDIENQPMNENGIEQKDEKIIENERLLKENFDKIESFFFKKKEVYESLKHIPIEEILSNAPNYYPIIRIIEQINSFLARDSAWLQKFVKKNNINFDWDEYKRWKASKDFKQYRYDDTRSPSKWVNIIQDYLIELLKALQILLYLECYISNDDFKSFLKKSPQVDLKRRKNYMKESRPSEDLHIIFEVVDYLLEMNMVHDFSANPVIDTSECMRIYKKLEKNKIFKLLKQKNFYIKYRMEYLRMMPLSDRKTIPHEEDLLNVCEEFGKLYYDISEYYHDYLGKLMYKYDKVSGKINKVYLKKRNR
ncbi:MAG: hypothetical protein MJB14_15690 [Spirochaetes bacterium]|nr:hypothetical protein [Spirochaetota bacterium]